MVADAIEQANHDCCIVTMTSTVAVIRFNPPPHNRLQLELPEIIFLLSVCAPVIGSSTFVLPTSMLTSAPSPLTTASSGNGSGSSAADWNDVCNIDRCIQPVSASLSQPLNSNSESIFPVYSHEVLSAVCS